MTADLITAIEDAWERRTEGTPTSSSVREPVDVAIDLPVIGVSIPHWFD